MSHMFNLRTLRSVVLLGGALLLPFVATPDESSAWVVYPGSNCQPNVAVSWADHYDGDSSSTSTTNGVYILCPIEDFDVDDTYDNIDVSVYVEDQSTAETLSCSLWTSAYWGTGAGSVTDTTGATSFEGTDTLVLDTSIGSVDRLFIRCYVPARQGSDSSIWTYAYQYHT